MSIETRKDVVLKKPQSSMEAVNKGRKKHPAKLLRIAGHLQSLSLKRARRNMELFFPGEPENRREWALYVWQNRSGPDNAERRLALSRKIEEVLYTEI